MKRYERIGWLLAIFLIGAVLRLLLLAEVPPGLTHDEADHGLDAWGVVNGIRPIYFATAYGREPLYDYATAGLMSFMGPTFLASRMMAAFFSLLMLAGTFGWVRRAFNSRIALLTTAGLAFSFWAVMTGRHALRTVTMPALFALVALLYWNGLNSRSKLVTQANLLAAGALLGATFYTYFPARIMWFLFVAMAVYLWYFDRTLARRKMTGTVLMLLVAGLIALPLFNFLAETGAEQRLDQLRGPIDAALQGDFGRILDNIRGGLRVLTIEGESGPIAWRYNVPGRPLLNPLVGMLFYLGLLVAVVFGLKLDQLADLDLPFLGNVDAKMRHACAFAVMWLIGGMVPVLLTGPDASVTRAAAIQPVVYLFPALAIELLLRVVRLDALQTADNAEHTPASADNYALMLVTLALLFGLLAFDTGRTYFNTWANLPEVRVHYETALVEAIDYLNDNRPANLAISSPSPDRYHDPSVALMTLHTDAADVRWFNAQSSLLLPDAAQTTLVLPGYAALDPNLTPYLLDQSSVTHEISLRESDLNRPVTFIDIGAQSLRRELMQSVFEPIEPVTFGDAATLLGYDLITFGPRAGGRLQIATLWQAEKPIDSAVLFTHLIDNPTLPPIGQDDKLAVPSYYWKTGDQFVQLHTLTIPDRADGTYELAVGAYQRFGDNIQPLLTNNGVGRITLTNIEITP